MNKGMMVAACLLALIFLTFGVRIASAHTTVKSGPYAIEIGWVSEPPIIGQMNASWSIYPPRTHLCTT